MVYFIHPFMPILEDCEDELYAAYKEAVSEDIFCDEIRVKIISSRIYFALLLFNFLFIIYTTGYYICRTRSAKWYTLQPGSELDTTAETHRSNLTKQWQMYSLSKRSLFGTVLGAIGHLVFTTFVLLYQVVSGDRACEFYLWGPFVGFYIWTYAIIWRTLRLHLLIRVNELQQRFLSSTGKLSSSLQQPRSVRLSPSAATATSTSLSTSTSSKRTVKEDEDYLWFMRHKDTLNLSTSYQLFKFLAMLLIIAVVIIIVETTHVRPPRHGAKAQCRYMYGNIVNVSMASVFFVLVVPFIVWYLRADKDAHGIRKEIMITMGVGAPCLIISIVWQLVFDPPHKESPAAIRGIFGPLNWLILVTTTNHIVSVIWPLFKRLSLKPTMFQASSGRLLQKPKSRRNKKKKRKRRSNQQASKSSRLHRCFRKLGNGLNELRGHSLRDVSRNAMTGTIIPVCQQDCNDCPLELTAESLTQALSSPTMLRVLQSWAVKDFSVENILFYAKYLEFTQRIKVQVASPSDPQSTSTTEELNSEILNTPFEKECIPDLVQFYTTFIEDQAPLQINISFAAREKLDIAFEPFIRKDRPRKGNGTHSIDSSKTIDFTQPISSTPSKREQKWHEDLSENIIIDSPRAMKAKSKKTSTNHQQHLDWLLNPSSPLISNNEPFEYILSPNFSTHDTHRLMPIFTPTLQTSTIMTSKSPRSDTSSRRNSPTSSITKEHPTTIANTPNTISNNAPIYISSRPVSNLSITSVDACTITLQLFEQARKEVFWNIFFGLFPKVVTAYHSEQTS